MRFKLKEKQKSTEWTRKFVFCKRTQDNYRVILDRVWVKWHMHMNGGHWVYKVEK